jgi:hypothetical protein
MNHSWFLSFVLDLRPTPDTLDAIKAITLSRHAAGRSQVVVESHRQGGEGRVAIVQSTPLLTSDRDEAR